MSFQSHNISLLKKLKAEMRSSEQIAIQKAKELSQYKEWDGIKDEFEKGRFSESLYKRAKERFGDKADSLRKELSEANSRTNFIKSKISRIIAQDPSLSCLLFFDDFDEQGKGDFLVKGKNVRVKDNRTQYSDVILINSKNEILFTVRNKNDNFEPGKYCLPGGHIEEDEEPISAAVRELEEETGISLKESQVQSCGQYFDKKSHINYFCAHYDGDPVVLDEREQQQFEWVSIDDVNDKPLLMNLKENFKNIIEIPKSILNPLADNAKKYYFSGDEITSEELLERLKVLENLYKGFLEGEVFLQDYENEKNFLDIEKASREGLVQKKVTVTGKNGNTYQAIRWVKPEAASKKVYRTDRSGNPIGDGSYHHNYDIRDFGDKYPEIEHTVNLSQSTESVYVTYSSPKTHKSVTLRFSDHENNAVKFGDQLNGILASDDEVLYKLGYKKRTFIPLKRLFIGTQQIAKKKLKDYEEADKTIQELYALGAGADLSKYKGKRAKGSNYLILDDKVGEYIETRRNFLGNKVQIGDYVYEDIKDEEIAKSLENHPFEEFLFIDSQGNPHWNISIDDLNKSKKPDPVGTITTRKDGKRYIKIAPGKWVLYKKSLHKEFTGNLFDNTEKQRSEAEFKKEEISIPEESFDRFTIIPIDIASDFIQEHPDVKATWIDRSGHKKWNGNANSSIIAHEIAAVLASKKATRSLYRAEGVDYLYYNGKMVPQKELAQKGYLKYAMFRDPDLSENTKVYKYEYTDVPDRGNGQWYDQIGSREVIRDPNVSPGNAIPFQVKLKQPKKKDK